ncbi:MAG: hypothetical protein K8R58_03230, partial [Bacteroidales bacterium]|nr:hypothetical protein [Bacteroidales bacterium]
MKKFTKICQLMVILMLSSAVVFAQTTRTAANKDVEAKLAGNVIETTVNDVTPNPNNEPIPSEALFDFLFEYAVGVAGGEAGIETDGSNIYTAKWNGGDFYRYQMDGTYLGSFTIAGASNIRDLAYDGTYFYG